MSSWTSSMKTNFISRVKVIQQASFQVGKQCNLLHPQDLPPNLHCCLKKWSTLWSEPLKIPRLFNYSVSCLLVILLYPYYNIDSYFWRPEQTRLIIWSVLLHNTHHSISPSDLWIKPCTLWEIQAILILSPHAGDFTTSSVSHSRHLLSLRLRHSSFISNLDFSGFFTFQDLCPAVLKAQEPFGILSFTACRDFILRPRGPLSLLLR